MSSVLHLLFLLQVPASCETTAADGSVSNGCQEVYLTPDQMAQLAEYSQGNTAFIAGYLGFAIIALAGIFWRNTGA